jgi:hypothetical protein
LITAGQHNGYDKKYPYKEGKTTIIFAISWHQMLLVFQEIDEVLRH